MDDFQLAPSTFHLLAFIAFHHISVVSELLYDEVPQSNIGRSSFYRLQQCLFDAATGGTWSSGPQCRPSESSPVDDGGRDL